MVRNDEGGRDGTSPVRFTALDLDWAVSVARAVHHEGRRTPFAPVLDEVWVTPDLALHVRYRIGSEALALRVGRLDLDPTSGRAPHDSATLASNLLHTLHDAPDDRAWTDGSGHGWWGDSPAAGWASVDEAARLLTLP